MGNFETELNKKNMFPDGEREDNIMSSFQIIAGRLRLSQLILNRLLVQSKMMKYCMMELTVQLLNPNSISIDRRLEYMI
jgi:hypothetical protein